MTGFGLEDLGIPLRENRTIETDAYLQTLYPNIYACGDVAGPYQFTHTASHMAWYCAVNALFGRFIGHKAHWIAVPALFASFVTSCLVFSRVWHGETWTGDLFPWVIAGPFKALEVISGRFDALGKRAQAMTHLRTARKLYG